MNAVMLYSMIWMVHWFPTPGIACLTTRKEPLKFLKWFSNFELEYNDSNTDSDTGDTYGDSDTSVETNISNYDFKGICATNESLDILRAKMVQSQLKENQKVVFYECVNATSGS